ncbi:hypothetical protein LRP31_28755 [Mesorhizobium mediterraneum]|nr:MULTISPECIES: hypothetical protein [Mesorhizobium]WIW52988.1 hypothetical protein LRP31_28755 [Mesorhizobium mediterraneum]
MKLVNHTALLLELELGAVRLGRTRTVTGGAATLIIRLHDDGSAVGE